MTSTNPTEPETGTRMLAQPALNKTHLAFVYDNSLWRVEREGGEVTAPNEAFWTEEEGYGIENVGVAPDIEVEQWPVEVNAGRDPQLDRSIEEVLRLLDENPPHKPKRPDFPVRVRNPIRESHQEER